MVSNVRIPVPFTGESLLSSVELSDSWSLLLESESSEPSDSDEVIISGSLLTPPPIPATAGGGNRSRSEGKLTSTLGGIDGSLGI